MALTSVPGAGTTVNLTLDPPVAPDADADADAGTDAGPVLGEGGVLLRTAASPVAGLRVRAVDDNAMSRAVLDALRHPLGAEAVLASPWEEAIGIADMTVLDVVLMDISILGMDGVNAMKRIKGRLGARAPAIGAVSAHAMTHEVAEFLRQGFDDDLPKPMTRAALLRRLSGPTEAREAAIPAPAATAI